MCGHKVKKSSGKTSHAPSKHYNLITTRRAADQEAQQEKREAIETDDALEAYNQCLRGTLYGLSSDRDELRCLNLVRIIYVRLRVAVWG